MPSLDPSRERVWERSHARRLARATTLVSTGRGDRPIGLKEVRTPRMSQSSPLCACGAGTTSPANGGVCQGCGSPITAASRLVMASPRSAAQTPASAPPTGQPADRPTRPDAVPSAGPRSATEPSRSVHSARLVSLIVSAVSGGPQTEEGRPGLIIRFFTPQGQLITEVRPGAAAYEEALRLALG